MKNSPCKGGLVKIHEVEEESHSIVGMSDESSFEGSSSPSPKKSLSPNKSPIKENMGPAIILGEL